MRVLAGIGIMLLAPLSVYAHAGVPPEPHDLWTAWTFDPGVILPLAITAAVFARGARKAHRVSFRQAAAFWTGWLVLVIALMSPLHALGEALFSAHMAQHELLMLGAAPLLVLSRPLVPMLWAIPTSWRRAIGRCTKTGFVHGSWRTITHPFAAWWIHAAALWGWHAPALFQATLFSDSVHAAQHISFLGSALLFWWSLFYARGRAGHGIGVLYIFTTAVHTSILGALLTFAPRVWYAAYTGRSAAWGLSALEDQQLGGLIMWVPAGLVYVVAGLALFAAWLQASDLMAARRNYAD
jgi:putative membrane protein